jgi:hypothetical protein
VSSTPPGGRAVDRTDFLRAAHHRSPRPLGQAQRPELCSAPVGSKGKKPRKPSHSQHLPKVGSAAEQSRLQHDERSAVADVMGFGSASSGTKTVVFVLGACVLVGAIVALILVLIS